MAEKKGLGLPQTRGMFQLRGIVTGMKRENALKTGETKTKKKRNVLNMGVTTAPESTVYVTIEGMVKEEVYFGKKSEVKGEKGETIKVPWAKRFDKQPEGFNMYGVALGIEKDDEGNNVKKVLTEYDATTEVHKKLEDGQSVFIRGDIDYSSFKTDDEIRKNKKFMIKNLYLAKEIDFEDEKFAEMNDFKQRIVYMGIEKVEDKDDPRFQVNAKIVTHQTIEETDFIIRESSLANQFRKNLKPYTAIDVWGNIYNKVDSEEMEEPSKKAWGKEDSFKRLNKNYIRELVITGADPESIDTETYTEKIIEEALKVLKEFGDSEEKSSWGNKQRKEEDEGSDDGLPW
ncbi:hypothetical protein [Brevibacillus porteri]|uniref:hypothetical protein n=1 Tax=Brevibacillus porteri TaxID=2126350 RepID=UPI00362ED46D